MNKTNEQNFKDHFHMLGTAMTNISICMSIYLGHNNYSVKFDNFVN